MAVAREERRSFNKPVVVLADLDKSTMDDAVAEALGEDLELDVITRQGCPYDAEALEAIAAGVGERDAVITPRNATVVVVMPSVVVEQATHGRLSCCSQIVKAQWRQTRALQPHWLPLRGCLRAWGSKTWWCSHHKRMVLLFFRLVR